MIWKREVTLEALNAMGEGNMVGLLDIRFVHIGDDTLEATMPVDHRTKQPFGLLHGGASVVLAESIGSVAGYLCTQGEQKVVGLEINANHIRSAREGLVRGVCRALHTGSRHQVWQWCYTVQVLNTSEDDMSTQLDPAQLAIEFLRRDKTDLSPAQYLKRLKQLELEFADLLALSSTELKEEIYFAWRMGVH